MTDYTKLFSAITKLYEQTQEPELVPAVPTFPFPTMYPGQLTCFNAMQGFGESALVSHTGSGKTSLFLSLTRNVPTLIIEPRKYLQKQCQTYYNDYVLFGKSEYPCKHARNASVAPCSGRILCTMTKHHENCPRATTTCLTDPCTIFNTGTGKDEYRRLMLKYHPDVNPSPNATEITRDIIAKYKSGYYGGYARYPCEGCVYIKAVRDAIKTLDAKGTVICNFGNFWNLMKHAEVIVVDEADLFFREISSPTKMHYSNSKEHSEDTVKALLTREQKGLEGALKTSDAKSAYGIQNMLYTVQFLQTHSELCFKYQKKDKIYVEVSPDNVSILKDKLFKGKRLLIVSATLGDFDIPQYSYSVWQRRGIFFKPVGKMTSRNLALQPWLMDNAAKMIEEISGIAEVKYDTHKWVIHSGNLGNHGAKVTELLGKEDCTLHERGNLMKTIDDFVQSDKRYLVVAGADYGGSFDWCKVQFVLKFPYANLDERMRVLERTMGKEKFNKFYTNEARSRFTQSVGRNCRGFGDFGVTIVLDSKFWEDWQQSKMLYPEWLRNSFDEKVY